MKWKLGPAKLGGKPYSRWSEDEKNGLHDSFVECAGVFGEVCKRAKEEGQDIFIKEHMNWILDPIAESAWAFNEKDGVAIEIAWTIEVDTPVGHFQSHTEGNETIFSDEFLGTWLPTFLIRHPALVFPSLYRTIFDTGGANAARTEAYHVIEMTIHWSRALYDWYKLQSSINPPWPIVLDADDVIDKPEVVRHYCQILGFDQEKLKFEWAPATESELAKMDTVERRMMSAIAASRGIVGGKTAEGLDIDLEAVKWEHEFGPIEAKKIEGWVRRAMPDYEYMKEKRLHL